MLPLLSRTRRALAAGCLALLLGAVAACGGSDSSDSSGNGSGSAGSAAEAPVEKGAFPVTIRHKFGSTKITSAPRRVVTVGLSDQDPALALGTVPVATTEWLGNFPGAIGPWAKKALGSAKPPTVLKDPGTGPQAERIAALRPDLILALYAGLTKDQYRTLSKIAPVVAQPSGMADYGISWQEQTETVGRALGRPAAAKKLVADVEKRFSDAAAEHPEFQGASAVVATPYQGLYVYGPQDNRTRLLHDLGFRQPAGLAKAVGPDDFGANISKERTDLLDNDATVWIVTDPAKDTAKLHGNGLYGDRRVVKEGREVFVKDSSEYGSAVSFVSVLSLPYTLERMVPQLAAAVDGKPSTKVPAADSGR
ncbi:iron-siderophore ABC transporter substrate-binding protein [Streptomyces sp. NPDC050560]|uniref:iron-siderophore ABC transporter substrate-binding protein n=1 Tax=Streptomyces sp. NPDC050560 TaxID=3365630 RepID=UPI003799A1C9